MATDLPGSKASEHTLVRGGASHHVATRLGFEPPTLHRRLLKVVTLLCVTWVPLLVLSFLWGSAWGDRVKLPLLADPVVYSRFLFVLPLLELAQVAVETSLGIQMRHFLDSGLVPEHERPEFESAQAAVIRLRGSFGVELAILAVALAICLAMRVIVTQGRTESSWERMGTTITPAGWWYILVSLPILGFFLIRWAWIFLLWAWFLFAVSRLDLELTPTHPDRAGGLGFLGWGVASFALVLTAVSAVLSGSFAREIIRRNSSLDELKYHIMIFVVLAIAIIHAPLCSFFGRLARCRFRALLDFGTLIWHHDRAFDEKWIKRLPAEPEGLLGSRDAASLVQLAQAFEHVDRMQLVPFDKKAVIVLVLAALIPMVPLVGTAIPITEILSKIGELMV
jgi:hypothetical protein